jgi:hypothetical protein
MEKNLKIGLGLAAVVGAVYLLSRKNKKMNFEGMNDSFEDFSEKRGEGAAKIAENAKEKGGLSILTYHHFEVKAPYYKKAEEGQFNYNESMLELNLLIGELNEGVKNMTIEQIEFQKLLGKIEVLGELLIEDKEIYE